MTAPDIYIHKLQSATYPKAPFHPGKQYPELTSNKCDERNEIYGAVRTVFYQLGFDRENFGSAQWNPLKSILSKGDTVLLKPNFVKGNHPLGLDGVLSMITHASIMRPVIDYILLATDGEVSIIIGDVPLQSSVWQDIIEKSGVKALRDYYTNRGIDIQLLDMRREIAIFNTENVIERKIPAKGRQKEDYRVVDMGRQSALSEIHHYADKLEITDYGYGTVRKHHGYRKNEYLIAQEILDANCVINLPKVKTHRKAGLTGAMKNLIGINGDKSWIAHHRRGLPKNGGDEFEKLHFKVLLRERFWNYIKTKKWGIRFATLLKIFFRKFIWHGKSYEEISMDDNSTHYREGSWHGNDTIWRCIRDLNQILLYADSNGQMHDTHQRQYLCLVDGVLAGEKEGPMEHLPKKTGVVVGGLNPVAIDYTIAEIMGFDYRKIPSIYNGFDLKNYPLINKAAADIMIKANCHNVDYHFKFIPSKGWKKLYDSYRGEGNE